MARRPLIAGNWKMNGSLGESRELVDALRAGVGSGSGADMLLCPAVRLPPGRRRMDRGQLVALGAQDVARQAG